MDTPSLNDRHQRFLTDLRWSLEEKPIDHGMDHPAEDILQKALDDESEDTVQKWIWGCVTETDRPHIAELVLYCLGHRPPIGSPAWRAGLIREAFASQPLEVRDEAAETAESWALEARDEAAETKQPWNDTELAAVLEDQIGKETAPWFKQYLRTVVELIHSSRRDVDTAAVSAAITASTAVGNTAP